MAFASVCFQRQLEFTSEVDKEFFTKVVHMDMAVLLAVGGKFV